MTLGGLALAVGILVDDATVTIENIERHLHQGSDLHKAILEGAGEIAVPAFVSTICICIVFVPMFFLNRGVARYLFVPLAEAVVFAMLASYVLSRTLVPTLVMLMMGKVHEDPNARPSLLQRVLPPFRRGFRAPARRLYRDPEHPAVAPQDVYQPVSRLLRVVLRIVFRAGPRFFPDRRCRPDSPAPACTHPAPASRGNGAARRPGRRGDPRNHPQGRVAHGDRQPGTALQRHQPVVRQTRAPSARWTARS